MKKSTVILIIIILGVLLSTIVFNKILVAYSSNIPSTSVQQKDYENCVEEKENQETINETFIFRSVFNYVFEGSPEIPNYVLGHRQFIGTRKTYKIYRNKITSYNSLVDFSFSKSYLTGGSFLDVSNHDITIKYQVNDNKSDNLGESLASYLAYISIVKNDVTYRLKFVSPNHLGYLNFFNYVESQINRGTDDTEVFVNVSDFYSIFDETRNEYVNANIIFSFVVSEEYTSTTLIENIDNFN